MVLRSAITIQAERVCIFKFLKQLHYKEEQFDKWLHFSVNGLLQNLQNVNSVTEIG